MHNHPPGAQPNYGALVISLDFELHWGVRDTRGPSSSYSRNLLAEWQVIPRILDLFEEFAVAATWASVGFLFARSRQELTHFSPTIRPAYRNTALDPYSEPIGESERDDPLHYAPSLIAAIAERPRQEIGTHTFSHYYCLEAGQGRAAFKADLESSVAIARAHGIQLRSIVFPRNQFNPAYCDLLSDAGITCYRGNPKSYGFQTGDGSAHVRAYQRGARLLDTYLNLWGSNSTPWHEVVQPNGLCDVPASRFLRPYVPAPRALEQLQVRRIVQSMRAAARTNQIYHLWWHPHNFGSNSEENLALLRRLLTAFSHLRETYGMASLTMAEAAAVARSHSEVAIAQM